MPTPELLTARPWDALPLPPQPDGTAFVVTSPFGMRGGRMHRGVDLRAKIGTPLYAPFPAAVARVVDDARGGLVLVLVDHEGAELKAMHLSRVDVERGQVVAAGQQVGATGNTGTTSSGRPYAPHLHLEFWDASGTPVDPVPFLDELAGELDDEQPSSAIVTMGAVGFFGGLLLALARLLGRK